jgi:replicative DNA helicase
MMSKQKSANRAKDSEILVLGTVVNYRGAYEHISDLIESPDAFQEHDHRVIWLAITQLAKEAQSIDMFSIVAKMRLIGGVENPSYTISTLKSLTLVGDGLRQHAMKVVENHIRIATRNLCAKFASISDDDLQAADPFEYNERIITGATDILNLITKVAIRDTKQVMVEFMDELKATMKAVSDGAKIVGAPTGLADMDEILGGFKPQKLYLLAARPAMGKSAYGCCHAPMSLGETNTPSGIVSTEMGRVELMGRMVAQLTGVDSFLIQNGTIDGPDYQKIIEGTGKVEAMPIYIEDHNHSIMSLISCIRQMHRRYKCKVIFVDYIQRIMADKTMSRANKNEMVGHFAKTLKSIAKELDIAIVALAQLSREVERRPAKIPQLADLRDSGELEQEADVVIFMYRPSYYKEQYFQQQHTEIYQYGQSTYGHEANAFLGSLCYFEIAKHRGGKIGRFWCRYDKKTSRFSDISKRVQAQMGGDQMDMPSAIEPDYREKSDQMPF